MTGGGNPQLVSIRSTPAEADVKILDAATGASLLTGKTPFQVNLEKSRGYFKGAKYRIVVEKPGFASREVIVDSNANGWYIGGNIILGGLIGWLIVDPATGAMWSLSPTEMNLTLDAAQPTAQASPPVSVLELDDFAAQHPNLLSKLRRLR